jgi:hypothetical protein
LKPNRRPQSWIQRFWNATPKKPIFDTKAACGWTGRQRKNSLPILWIRLSASLQGWRKLENRKPN